MERLRLIISTYDATERICQFSYSFQSALEFTLKEGLIVENSSHDRKYNPSVPRLSSLFHSRSLSVVLCRHSDFCWNRAVKSSRFDPQKMKTPQCI